MTKRPATILFACLGLLLRPDLADSQLSFDGIDDRVTVPYDSSFPTEVFTIAAWIKLASPSGRAAIIARGEDDNSFNLSWHLYVLADGTLEIMLEDTGEDNHCYPRTCMGQPQASCVTGDLFVADNTWRHVAATCDATGALALYVDGQSRTTCTGTGVPSSNNFQDLTIGSTHGSIGPLPPGGTEPPIWFFPGLIDDPAMWSVSLSAPQIGNVHANGVTSTPSGLAGYWNLDEGTAQLVADSSPAGNSGFLGAVNSPDDADPAWISDSPAGTPTPPATPTPSPTPTPTPTPTDPTPTPTSTPQPPDPTPTPTPYVPVDCAASQETLCLNQERFQVEVEWRDFKDRTGTGQAVVNSQDSGLFWFFNPDNWELMVKVLDGCGINDRYWVFASATTNVEYTLRVIDSDTGLMQEYSNPLGTAARAITDTAAFATCP